jgi:hypothetical protein
MDASCHRRWAASLLEQAGGEPDPVEHLALIERAAGCLARATVLDGEEQRAPRPPAASVGSWRKLFTSFRVSYRGGR